MELRELEIWLGENLFDKGPCCRCEGRGVIMAGTGGKCRECGLYVVVERWSEYMGAAWQVVERMHERTFSIRARFLGELQRQVSILSASKGTFVAWPDLLFYITPEAICRAAYATLTRAAAAPSPRPDPCPLGLGCTAERDATPRPSGESLESPRSAESPMSG